MKTVKIDIEGGPVETFIKDGKFYRLAVDDFGTTFSQFLENVNSLYNGPTYNFTIKLYKETVKAYAEHYEKTEGCFYIKLDRKALLLEVLKYAELTLKRMDNAGNYSGTETLSVSINDIIEFKKELEEND
jgi:hypothetical protein